MILLLLGAPLSTRAEVGRPLRPNFLFILVDDMGFSDLGSYGGEIATPNIDKLAADGLQFTQFYNTARCWPTRAALLTGYYAQQVRRDSLGGYLGGVQDRRPRWARLLPEYLRLHGYRSYHSGKWHIDGKVLAGGFDRSLMRKARGNYFSARGTSIDDSPVKPRADESGYYATTATADHVIDTLRDHAANHASQPFFQYLAFLAPHFPLHALPADIARYRDEYLVGWDAVRKSRFRRQRKLGLHNTTLSKLEPEIGPPHHYPLDLKKLGPGEVNRPLPWDRLSDEQRRFQATKMALHAAMVDRVDQEVGRVIKELKAMGEYENTVIFFASDNGANAAIMIRHGDHDPAADPGSADSYLCLGPGFSSASNTPFRRHKNWVHEGGIATPLIVHWPAGIKARGEFRRTPAHVIDIVPTILELAGIAKPKKWKSRPIPPAPGRSLVPAFSQDVRIKRDFLWWMHEGHRAVRVGDWKLVASHGDPWELYDMRTDRAESRNRIGQKPRLARMLEAVWQNQFEATLKLASRKQKPLSSPKRPGKKAGK